MPSINIFSSAPRVFSMKERYARIILALFILLLLDLTRPLGYSLHTEFLFLGVLSIFLTYPYFPAVAWGCIFGYLKDSLAGGGAPINLIEFFFFFMLIRYFLQRLRSSQAARLVITLAMIAMHIAVNNLYSANFYAAFSLLFFLHSFLIFLPLNYLLKRWMKLSPAGYI